MYVVRGGNKQDDSHNQNDREPIDTSRSGSYGSIMGSGNFSSINNAALDNKQLSSTNGNGLIINSINGTKIPKDGAFPPEPIVTGAGDGTVRMKRQIGLMGGIAMIVGTMVGMCCVIKFIFSNIGTGLKGAVTSIL